MPYIRKLPSGLWQATVRMPNGKRISETDALKSVVKAWAQEQEARFARGDVRDPRAGRITVREWHDNFWWPARVVATSTARKNRERLDRYVLPYWEDWPLEAITRTGIEGWVKQLGKNGGRDRDGKPKPLGAPSIHMAVRTFSVMLQAATEETPPIILTNPCRGAKLPRRPARKRRYFTDEEMALILDNLVEPYRTLAELSMWSGLRWEELAGLHGDGVDWLRGLILGVRWVMTADGLRPYPKTEESDRIIPVPEHVLAAMSKLMEGRDLTEPVFINRRGRPLNYKTWYWHWTRALGRVDVPYANPHTCRHTAASRLMQDGTPIIEVKAILGHRSISTTEQYSHHDPNAHAAIKAAWKKRGSGRISDAREATE